VAVEAAPAELRFSGFAVRGRAKLVIALQVLAVEIAGDDGDLDVDGSRS